MKKRTVCLILGISILNFFPVLPTQLFAARVEMDVKVIPPPPTRADLAVSIAFDDPSGNRALDAEEKATLRIAITNRGPGKAHGVEVLVKALSGGESVSVPTRVKLGDISAGKKKQASLALSAGRRLKSGKLRIKISALEANGFDADPVIVTFSTRKFEPARLEVADLGIDDAGQNGQVEPMEIVTVTARIQNTGKGKARGASALVEFGPNVFKALDSSLYFDVGDLEPGNFKDIRFSFYTNKRIRSGEQIPVHVVLSERGTDSKVRTPINLVMNVSQKKVGELIIREKQQEGPTTQKLPALSVDVDQNIPEGLPAGSYDFAIIVGNQNYKHPDVPDVEFAYRDLGVIREYLIKTFGLSPKNIIEERDATKGDFGTLFGTRNSRKYKLFDWIKPGKSRVFIYYVGHGAPDIETGDGYFVPVEADPNYIASAGYPLSLFYANLKRVPAKEMVVVLDTCFSGRTPKGSLFKETSLIQLDVRETVENLKQGAVLASARKNQVSAWYPAKRHSLFTYFFLKGLQGAADANRDKTITVGEMESWLGEQVSYWAKREQGNSQNPVVKGKKDLVLVRLK